MPVGRPIPAYEQTIETQDRPRGILSKRDRQFLLEESYRAGLADQSRRNVRSRIRERVRHAILDFYLLDEHLDKWEQDRVFADIDEPLTEGLHGLFALVYRAADEDVETIESWFEDGLAHIQLDNGSGLLVERPTVDIDVTRGQSVNRETAEEKLEAGHLEALSDAEMRYLLWKLGKLFGGTETENPLVRGLGEYARRFEAQTQLSEARELINETNDEE